MKKKINIAVVGLGNIGSHFCNDLLIQKKDIFLKSGININLLSVSAKNIKKKRKFKFKKSQWVNNPLNIATNPIIDIVVELVGGSEGLAKKLAYLSLINKKHFITANKSLVAKHGNYLAKLAEKNKVNFEFEASVAAGMPIIRSIKEGLVSNKIFKLTGILNGTSNFILTRMEHTGKTFSDVLHEAKSLGYAEANPKSDLDGADVASKIKILTSLCFKTLISNNKILVEGIENIETIDIINAKKLGYKIKLLGITEIKNKKIFERVHPSLVKINSYIANIDGIYNATIIKSNPVGQSVMQGEGAGPGPTTSGLMSDLHSVIRGNIKYPFSIPNKIRKKVKSFNFLDYSYSCYLRFEVKDKPGVLSSITENLAKYSISIKRLLQIPNKLNNSASIIIVTHSTLEKKIKNSLAKLKKKKYLLKSPIFIRIQEVNDDK